MNRVLERDLRNRIAVVEPGVINQDVTKAVAAGGFFFAPDPSSQAACSIGGEISKKSRGPPTPGPRRPAQQVRGVPGAPSWARAGLVGGGAPGSPRVPLW